jgi:hypothetical protein
MCPPFLHGSVPQVVSLLPCVIQEWVLSASQNKANFNVVAPNFQPQDNQQLPQPQPLGKAVCSHLKHSTPSDGVFHASAGGSRVCCASAVPQCAPMVMLMDSIRVVLLLLAVTLWATESIEHSGSKSPAGPSSPQKARYALVLILRAGRVKRP